MLLALMLETATVHIFCPQSARDGGSRGQCDSPAPWNRQNWQLGPSWLVCFGFLLWEVSGFINS